jgi:hypothetical protein
MKILIPQTRGSSETFWCNNKQISQPGLNKDVSELDFTNFYSQKSFRKVERQFESRCEMKKLSIATLMFMAGFALTGCVVSGPESTLPAVVEPQQLGPQGNWIGTDGVAISTFGNGLFTSYAADTGARLAEGSYSVSNGNLVQLTLRSLVRGTTSQVNCLQVQQQQLNCTAASGSQFSLVRTSRTPPPPALPAVTSVAPPKIQG